MYNQTWLCGIDINDKDYNHFVFLDNNNLNDVF